jgi:pyridoxine kinase
MDILSVQSAVVHGIVGNNAAVPVLQSLGWQPLALHTAWYSHHKGHAGWFGEATRLEVFGPFLSYAMQAEHLRVTTVLSGYLASAAQAEVLAQHLPTGIRYVCDPVMGDLAGQYVSNELVQAYRHLLVPRATILIPNIFELGLLVDQSVSTPAAAREIARQLLGHHAALQVVVVTGIPHAGRLHLLAVSRERLVRVQHPQIVYRVSGTGDVFSAAWLGLYLRTYDLEVSLTYAAQFVYRIVQRTAREQQRELQLAPELPWLQQAVQRLPALMSTRKDC